MRTKRFLAAIAAPTMVLSAFIALSSPASADTTAPNGTQVSYSQSTSKVGSKVQSAVSTSVKGKVNLRFVMKNGYKTSAKCFVVNSWQQGLRHNCFIVSKRMLGDHYANSGINSSGELDWFNGYVGDQYTPVGTKFYYDKAHKTWRKADCGNYVRLPHKLPKLKVANVNMVQSFNVQLTLKVAVREAITATATAWCQTANSSASATAAALGVGAASVVVKVSARTAAAARAKGVSSVQAKLVQKALVEAKAAAALKAAASATAKAECTSTPPPPPCTNCTPPTVSITTINDLDQGGTSPDFCATVDLPGSDTGTLVFTALYGSFSPAGFTASGMNTYCSTYKAFLDPTTTTTVQETVTVTVRDNTTGLSATQPETFLVRPLAVHPGYVWAV